LKAIQKATEATENLPVEKKFTSGDDLSCRLGEKGLFLALEIKWRELRPVKTKTKKEYE
jgi:hypothetical protein